MNILIRSTIVLLFLSAGAADAWAQASVSARLEVRSEVGLGTRPGESRVQRGDWVPVRVDIENVGEGALDAVVELTALGANEVVLYRAVSPSYFSPGSRRIVRFTVPGQPKVEQVRIQVLDSDRKYEYHQSLLDLQAIRPTDQLLVIVARDQTVLSWPARGKVPEGVPRRFSQMTTVGELPDEWVGLANVPVICFQDAEYELLTSTQARALQQWVESGGHLVVSAAAGTQALRDSPLAELLPAEIGAVDSALLDWDQLDPVEWPGAAIPETDFVRSSIGSRPTILAQFRNSSGERLFPHVERPLVVSRSLGLGRVTVAAFSFADSALNNWPATPWLSDVLFAPLNGHPEMKDLVWGGRMDMDDEIRLILQKETAFRVPPRRTIGILFATYLFVAIPFSYVILRRFMRPALAWLALPVMAVGYSVFVYASVYQQTGGRLLSSALGILETEAGRETARAHVVHSVFSPVRDTFEFSLDRDDAGLFPIPAGNTGQYLGGLSQPVVMPSPGGVTLRREFSAKSQAFVRTDAIADLGGAVTGTLRLVERKNEEGLMEWRAVGTVWNGLEKSLHNISFVGCRNWVGDIGDLEPGQNMDIDVLWPASDTDETVALESGEPGLESGRPESVIAQRLLRAVRDREAEHQSVCLIAETGGVPWSFEMEGEPLEPFAASVLVVHWPLEIEGEMHRFSRRAADIAFGPLFGWAGKTHGRGPYNRAVFKDNRHQAGVWLAPPPLVGDWRLVDVQEEGNVIDRMKSRIREMNEDRNQGGNRGPMGMMMAPRTPGVDKVFPYMVFDHRLQDWVQMVEGEALPPTARDPFRERVLVRPWGNRSWSGKRADEIVLDEGRVPAYPRNRIDLVVEREST